MPLKTRFLTLLTGGTLLVTAAACGSGAAETSPAAVKPGEKAKVVAAFYPLQWLTEQIAGSAVSVETLTAPGVEPHDLELTPQQVADVGGATLTAYVKGLQPAVDEAVEQNAGDKGFDAAAAVQTLPATEAEAADGGAEAHEHEHEVAYDPHLWLDPSRFAGVATKLGERLAAIDPAHAQAYKDRAAKTVAALTALDQEYAKGLGTCSTRSIVTAHAAFGYLADRYKLKQVGITMDPEAEPSPARIAEVSKVAKAENVTTIFTEALVSPKVAEVLANEVGAKTAVLDPMESRPSGGDYLSAMRQNLSTLRTALGCTA
ncbi:metal ABC transporter substrate-binding protein [Nonomuraea sp. NPDC049152]|uniref:metal ABC transporter substrate-binding protein n=1 Tax=Nonomuraea sp. NPDC049152 TaxID=3154350 RepID=UPI0033EC53F6